MLDDPVSAVLDGTGMVVRCAPVPLRVHLGCFWALPDERPVSIETLPDGGGQLVVEVHERAVGVFLSGPRCTPGRYRKAAHMKAIGVRLRPGVGYLLWGRPMCALVDRRARLVPDGLANDMAAAPTVDAGFDILERYVARRLPAAVMDTRVAAAIRAISQSSGCARVDDVACGCNTSRRHLERLMRRWVGLSPKRLSRIARFQAVLSRAANGTPGNWAGMAAESYADQSHLIHEFAEFAGVSPRKFYAAQSADVGPVRCG